MNALHETPAWNSILMIFTGYLIQYVPMLEKNADRPEQRVTIPIHVMRFGAAPVEFQNFEILSILQIVNASTLDVIPSKIKFSSTAYVVDDMQKPLIFFMLKTYEPAAAAKIERLT